MRFDLINISYLLALLRDFELGRNQTIGSAVAALREHHRASSEVDLVECGNCGADILDVDFCPYCGFQFSPQKPEVEGLSKEQIVTADRSYAGAPRANYDGPRIDVATLYNQLIFDLGLPSENIVKYKYTTALKCFWGNMATLMGHKFSISVYLPFDKEEYEDPYNIIVNVKKSKYGPCRIPYFQLEMSPVIADIIKQSVFFHKKRSDKVQEARREHDKLYQRKKRRTKNVRGTRK